MTKQIRINGQVYNCDDLVFLEGGRIEWKDYIERMCQLPDGAEYRSLNERSDGSFMPVEYLPDGLTRNEEDAKIDPAFLKVTNAIEAAAKDVENIAQVLRLAGMQGEKNAPRFANAAAQSIRNAADRVLRSTAPERGADSGDGIPTFHVGGGAASLEV